ncbi:MAG: bifunctional methionine sulfoxide reductase B/A protein [Phycisphaerales bacterium]|nr:MAG: bifunctional methionine sulfoxide reductase B/A protein [Phycisphaerales bacterium]
MTKTCRPRYSRSGYDLTPLTQEQIDEICRTLTPEQIKITQHAGTEPPFCGNLTDNDQPGIYVSVVGGLPLFRSEHKFKSGSGWASFFAPFDPDHIIERVDRSHGMVRTEILDARSGAHLGHVFDDGPPPTGLRYCLNSAALKFIPQGQELPVESRPVATETAYFAGGCFWGIEDRFAKVPGVVDAESGYQNGTTENPTYKEVCSGATGHAETVKVVFDPRYTSYEDLVRIFLDSHNPTLLNRQGPDVGTQYRSAIFTASEEQAEIARAVVEELTKKKAFNGRPIVTIIEPARTFWPAEEYHQDYHAKHGGSCGAPG